MKKIFLASSFLLLLLFSAFRHDFYISICEIEHNQAEESIEIILKIFTDDLEKTLEDLTRKKLYLGTEKEVANADALVSKYLQRYFQLEVNNIPLSYTYLGKEIEADAVWCYLEIKGVNGIGKMKIYNELLVEQCQGQTNIVHVKVGEEQKSLLLRKGKEEGTILF